jgi:hypothetical protein
MPKKSKRSTRLEAKAKHARAFRHNNSGETNAWSATPHMISTFVVLNVADNIDNL